LYFVFGSLFSIAAVSYWLTVHPIVTTETVLIITKPLLSEPPSTKFKANSRIRYRHKEDLSTIELIGEDEALIDFIKPQKAITPGQAVVFYNDDKLLGGGWIREVL